MKSPGENARSVPLPTAVEQYSEWKEVTFSNRATGPDGTPVARPVEEFERLWAQWIGPAVMKRAQRELYFEQIPSGRLEAGDVANDVWMVARRRWLHECEVVNVYAYALAVATNQVRRQAPKERRLISTPWEEPSADLEERPAGRVRVTVHGNVLPISEFMVDVAEQVAVNVARASLTGRQREAYERVFEHGQSREEAGRAMGGIKAGTVSNYVHQAKATMRTALEVTAVLAVIALGALAGGFVLDLLTNSPQWLTIATGTLLIVHHQLLPHLRDLLVRHQIHLSTGQRNERKRDREHPR